MHVSLAFDAHVVLSDLSFSVAPGSMKILLGASGSGKTVMLKLILGLLRPDSGMIFVNGQRIDDMRERDLLRVRADIGMLFQENALFDSLTVAENVGYRLYEASTFAARRGTAARRGSPGLRRPRRVHRPDAVDPVWRTAQARGDRPRDGVQARSIAVRRSHDRP